MKKALIIEDDAYIRDMFSDKFKTEGFMVLLASNGEEGLASALGNKPDIILLDIAMPKMDGIEMLKKLRTDAWGSKARVMILTNVNVDGSLLDSINQSSPAYCMLKAEVTPSQVYEKAKELLATPS